MATNLFSVPQQASGKTLVEFRAGKMTMSGNRVTADKRKGLIQLTQSPDGLIHFIWKDRTSGDIEDNLFIFPEEATFKRLNQVKDGRVYLLEFKSSAKKYFYWMQEPKDDQDEENCKKINQNIDNPPVPGEQGTGGPTGTGLGGIDQNALFQMFGGLPRQGGTQASNRGSSASQPSPSTASSLNPNIGVTDLQSILTGMGMPNSTLQSMLPRQGQQQRVSSPTVPTSSTGQQQQQREGASLSQIINADNVLPLIMNNQQVINQLLPLLPEERRTPEEIAAVLRSPQFQQSLETFSSALQSGQLTDMIRQFNINTTGGPQNIETFLQSLQNQSSSSSTSSSEKKDDKKKDDDKMDTN